MSSKPRTANDVLLQELQTPARYRQLVLELRKKRKLHDFVQWILMGTINNAFGQNFSVQPEKYGISNGRIDLALFHTPRTIIHFEFIATCQNGHVFRDTTSLLGSRADEKLAILIDKDVEPDVADNFFKAIPDSQVPHIFLRQVLLNADRGTFVATVKELIGRAEFKNGSTDPKRFYCSLPGGEIEIFKTLKFEYHNAPVGETLTIQLQQHESMFHAETLTGIHIKQPCGTIDVPVPYFHNTTGEAYYIGAYVSTGERWRTRVYLSRRVAAPVVFISEGEYPRFPRYDFPSGASRQEQLYVRSYGARRLVTGAITAERS
jgi:hypothetical protein